jgi:hypothetical protein
MYDKCIFCGCVIYPNMMWCRDHAPIGHYDQRDALLDERVKARAVDFTQRLIDHTAAD